MENASKALIIAGAIILSILIIGLGMFIFQQAQGAMQDTGMDEQQVAQYNSPFEQYAGTDNGTAVKTLIKSVNSHNRTAEDPSQQIGVIAATYEEDKANEGAAYSKEGEAKVISSSTILSGKTYTVTFEYDKKSGRIVNIGVEEKK